jgi:lysophospholipase L1-like esterase
MRWRWLALLLGAAILLAAAELALRARYRNRVLPPAIATERGKITIVALGDSITAGPAGAPDDAWPAILAARLRAGYPDVTWQVVNAGVPGDTAPLGYTRFDRDVAAHGPQAVLIAFGLNDCNLARHAMDRWYEGRVPVGPEQSYLWRAGQTRLERLSRYLGRVLRRLEGWLPGPTVELEAQPFPRTSPGGFSAALTALVARTREIGARPVLLTMTPLADEETPDLQAFRADYAACDARIRELARQHALPLVDLAAGVPDDAWEPDGLHLTAAGQRWVADRVYGRLDRAGIWEALAKGAR